MDGVFGTDKYDEDDQDDSDDAYATMTEAVTVAAEAATEATKQENDENDEMMRMMISMSPSDMIYSRFGTYSALRCLKPLHGYDRGGERQAALIQVNHVGCRTLLLSTPVREGSGETPA
jgi:hypothetical protein